ncbi:MAG: pyrroline-5-carboxylate reductase [Coriobacteriia bacterium]|nr:pyrroline-5-carboxylate reductase [Coriobacteriia bacterium]
MTKLGFIGCGNMAKAIIGGIVSQGLVSPQGIYVSNYSAASAARAEAELGVHAGTDNLAVVAQADVLFLSVKPQKYEDVIEQIRSSLRPAQIVVTIAPGKTLAWLAECLGCEVKIVRTMPNTPALVGEGFTSYCPNSLVTAEELDLVVRLLESYGVALRMDEHLIDAASAVGGSAPAFVYAFIEALADGGVAEGLPRAQAYEVAAQTVLGSAKMVLESGKHPGQLKDEVCSPAGSTIKGMEVLEKAAFRGSVIDAVRATAAAARGL